MALRSGYKGIKKLAAGLKWNRPGILAADDTALAKTFFPRSEQAVLGARNVAPQYTMASGTVTNGITVTYDANSVVNLNGTASADTYIGLRPRNTGATLPADARYKVSGRVSADCFTFLLGSDGSTVASSATEEGSTFDYTSAVANFGLIIYVKNGTVLSNQKVYPMITLASDTDTSFSAPAMTNEQLTDAVSSLSQKKLVNVDLNDINITGYYFTPNSSDIASITNKPSELTSAFVMEVVCRGQDFGYGENGNVAQIIKCTNSLIPIIYIRQREYNQGWGSWYKFTGTALT